MAFTTVNKSTDYFSANLYTGNGTSPRALTGFGHQPDWLWVKRRDGTGHHHINDVVMGATKWRYSDLTQGDDTSTQAITYGTDGITWNGGNYDSNTNTDTYVAWSWKAGGSGSANNDGFKLSEIDLQIRGEGKVTGTSQSGMSDLKVADIRYDYDILQSSKDYFENNVTTINEALIQEEAKILFPNFSKVEDST